MFESRLLNGAFMMGLLTMILAHRIEQSDSAWNNFMYFLALLATILFILLFVIEKVMVNNERKTPR